LKKEGRVGELRDKDKRKRRAIWMRYRRRE
jgi:hypothetical protein